MISMLFRTSASIIALFACTGLAAAADLEGPSYGGSLKDDVAAPVVHNWSGLYFGGHVGYGWGSNDAVSAGRDKDGKILMHPGQDPNDPTDDIPVVASNSYDSDGWLVGLQLGYNIQAGHWVVGIEGDYSWSDMSGSFNFDPNRPEAIAGGDVEWLATLRARVGRSFDRVLIYGTAGLAVAEFSGYVNNFYYPAPAVDRASASSTETGWVVGGGLEVAVTQNLSIKGEYLYMRFDDASAKMRGENWPDGHALHVDNDIDIQTFRVGVNYKFGN